MPVSDVITLLFFAYLFGVLTGIFMCEIYHCTEDEENEG